MENKKIFIIDEDQKLIVQLKDKLISLGYEVRIAINGGTALQKILSDPPDLIILELELKVISGTKISQILRANPKTADIPFFFLSRKPTEVESFVKFKDTFILKPFNYDEVISKIGAYFKGLEETVEVTDLNKEISGHLSQISLADLLQVFNMNKKSGRLVLKYEDKNGTIYIKEGNVINALIDEIEGEKAFYRILMRHEGRFSFLPDNLLPEGIPSISKISIGIDNLLMEGLRQLDEHEEIKDNLPALTATVKLKVDPRTMVKELKPLSQEIFVLMEFYSKVKDIVDSCSFSDYEVLKTLYTLLQKGVIEETSPRKDEVKKTFLFNPEQLLKIKKRLIETKGFRFNSGFSKILVMGENFEILKNIIQMFLLLKEFSINQKDLISSPKMGFLGVLGTLKLTEEMNILFYSLPILDDFKPLWNAFSQDTICVLLLLPQNGTKYSKNIKNAYGFFESNLKKMVKPILITNNKLRNDKLSQIKEDYKMKEVFNYNVKDKEGIRDFIVNLLIEIL
jgi:DNA-binding response OmpR family regulator